MFKLPNQWWKYDGLSNSFISVKNSDTRDNIIVTGDILLTYNERWGHRLDVVTNVWRDPNNKQINMITEPYHKGDV